MKQIIYALGLLLLLQSSAFADLKGFVQLCNEPGIEAGTRTTLDALRKLVSSFSNEKPLACDELAAELRKKTSIDLPGQTFFYYRVEDLNPIAELDWITALSIPHQPVTYLAPLARLKLKSLDITGVKLPISILADIKTLERLKLTAQSDTALDVLSVLDQLKSLTLATARVSPVALRALPWGLTELELLGDGVSDFSGLRPLRLKSLALGGVKSADLAWLDGSKTSLTHLVVNGGSVQDYGFASKLRSLADFQVNFSSLEDLSFLQGMKSLIALDLRHNKISDVRALSNLTNLRTLMLGWNSIWDADALAGLFKLETLELRSNSMNHFQMGYLERLKTLDLISNRLWAAPSSDVPDAEYKLEHLYLNQNEIRSVDRGIERFARLKTLTLSANRLRDVTALGKLAGLETLHLDDNKLSDVSPLSTLTKLKKLQLWDNVLPMPFKCPVLPESICGN